MSGIYVRCRSFQGGDKSASALQEVLDGLIFVPPHVLDAINPVFDDCHVSVSQEIVGVFLPYLRAYRAALVARIGHDDREKADRDARAAGVTGLREGDGWCLLCVDDAIAACETSAAEHEPVVFHYC